MLTLHYKKKNIQLPESFSELSSKQFIAIAGILYNGGDFLRCQLTAFKVLANLSRWRMIWMDTEFLDRAREHVNWIFDHEQLKEVRQQLVPEYKRLHGPISDFDNLVMKEFHFSELAYKELIYEEKHESIDKLIAAIYRPAKHNYDKKKNPDGDVREPFNANEAESYRRAIRKWPAPVKHAIFIWYDNCRQALIKNNPLVFNDPEKGFESQFDTGLYGMMRGLAGEKLGTIEKIENMYVHTALLEIGLIREEEAYLEEQMKVNSSA